MKSIVSSSTMVWFEPTGNFWKYISVLPWRYKKFYDCGAGAGHLTKLMTDKGFHVEAYDLYPRDKSEAEVLQCDTTSDAFQALPSECVVIARPCHGTGWVGGTLDNILDIGDAFYVGLTKNIKDDLDGFHYEIVARNVGAEKEVLARVYCRKSKGHCLRQIVVHGGRKEWWWYSKARNRYTSEPNGLSGFENNGEKVVAEVIRGNDLQLYTTKKDTCKSSLNCGWLAPDGEWFGCHSREHDSVAQYVIGCQVGRLEGLGFIRCYGDVGSGRMLWSFGHLDDSHARPTRPQIRVLRAKGYDPADHGGLYKDKDFI